MTDGLVPRSLLFMPGSKASMVAKIPVLAPDAAVVDLEDAVPAAQKAEARETAVAALAGLDAGPRTTVLVRVNPITSPWFADDLAAVAGLGGIGVVLPKYERREEIDVLRGRLGPDAPIVVGLETVRGVADCRELLRAGLDSVYFGAEDYIADIGGVRTTHGDEVLYARSEVRLAAHLAGVSAVDQAVVAIRDDDRFRADAAQGRAIGYTGKICVHPRQVELAHEVFTPAPDEVAHARAVLAAADEGVAVVDGQMVDDVHVRMARTVLARLPEER
ncbi:CoA ester lyase [Amycolatopsis sp. FDAARGOS 1241]|uniref:HpcH/HpaI aldolase/citrate lyase family protein n=1 Tax=Amycolatopsis sp. FDAARGOS 1241 TaxID=2778070 RepID=UPI00195017C1|nr:CoA ester lyase [Amycolatopsis sp. FDAARGOS 1241]QRP49266.1 CoA ester lyase [Amycolatopsis sp. FDAARGOS 1241]